MSTSSWWARRLADQTNATPQPPLVPRVPTARPVPMRPSSYPVSAPPTPASGATPAQATASKRAASCPECGGTNYALIGTQTGGGGTFEVRRCFDCGYPVQQTGGGLSTSSSEAGKPVARAQQVAPGGFNPGEIVGRIG